MLINDNGVFFQDMTGLVVDSREPLNVQHFGVGGPTWRERMKGNKMAMILFYVCENHIFFYTYIYFSFSLLQHKHTRQCESFF